MVDSGASETAASGEHFEGYPLALATASATSYSSASADPKEDIVNVGEKFAETVDENGATSWAKFQTCRGLRRDEVCWRRSAG